MKEKPKTNVYIFEDDYILLTKLKEHLPMQPSFQNIVSAAIKELAKKEGIK